jgi:fibronectin type 3 domain-containing protein
MPVFYYVYRSTSSSGTYDTIGTAGDTYYADSSLAAETTYYYRVKAVNSSDSSVFSSKAYATTSDATDIPDIPYNIIATAVSPTQIDLRWDLVDHAVYYNIYRAISSSELFPNRNRNLQLLSGLLCI